MCQFEQLFMSMSLSQRLLGEEFCVLLPGEFRVLPREECRSLGADHTGAEVDSQETFQCVSAKHLNTSDCRTLTTKPVKRDGQSAGTCARTLYQSGPGPGVLRLQSPRPIWRTRRPRSTARA